MVYSATYTTETIVKSILDNISANLDTTDITAFINMAEGECDAIMHCSARGLGTNKFTYSADKHGIITLFTTARAAYLCLCADPTKFAASSYAALQADLLYAIIAECKDFLSVKSNVDYLASIA